MRGWTGGADGTKVMIFEVDMPHCEEETCTWDRPAIWALNARVRDHPSFVPVDTNLSRNISTVLMKNNLQMAFIFWDIRVQYGRDIG